MGNICGLIFDIRRFSVNDGPGIRTTVFFKGCPLKCVWCHNPEGLGREPELFWDERRCLGSTHQCTVVCSKKALSGRHGEWKLYGEKCNSCGECARRCPTGAFQIIGSNMTIDELVGIILKDRVFYEHSGGGATFSGGEPFMQPEFLGEVLSRCKQEQLHTAVDTSGYASWEVIGPLLAGIDLFLYDLKLMDDTEHRKFTGVSNRMVLENLKKIVNAEKNVQVRIPLIPGITDTNKNIFDIIEFLEAMPSLRQVSLLNFHKGGGQKYLRKAMVYAMSGAEPLAVEEIGRIRKIFEKRGFGVSVGE
jgi:pyruvate formate lyase activating enzyme